MVFLISTLESYFSFLDHIDPSKLFYGMLTFTWLVSMWEHYLSYRQVFSSSSCVEHRRSSPSFSLPSQYQNYKRRRNVPAELTDVMTEVELEKARTYAMDKMRYNEIHSLFNEVETTVTRPKLFDRRTVLRLI